MAEKLWFLKSSREKPGNALVCTDWMRNKRTTLL
jgi:hypothetical protein